VPKTPTTSMEWELAILSRFSGASQFNGWYAKLEVQDHKQDIDDNKLEASQGVNAAIRALAREDLPVLRTHLKLSKQALPSS
jgi:putative membrane protein